MRSLLPLLIILFTYQIAFGQNKLESTGNVGIGTSSPNYLLHVKKGSSGTNGHNFADILVEDNDKGMIQIVTPSTGIGYFGFGNELDNYIGGMQYDHTNNRLIFRANNHNYNLSIDNNGSIGVGTLTPATTLEVNGDISLSRTHKITFLEKVNGGTRAYIGSTNGKNGDYNSLVFAVGGGTESMILRHNGNLGIGTLTPINKLQINNLNNDGINLDNKFRFRTSGTSNNFVLEHIADNGNLYFRSMVAGDAAGNIIINDLGGNVAIGGASTGSHKLAVHGSIGAREIKVEASGWSDFVFFDNYNLRSLEETEQYIQENQHLPDIPSEAEVTANGISLGEMDAKLLQKIEELTLYLIEQNKENQALKTEMESLKSRLEKLEKQ
ncbi:hypothetical protein [Reichenbachiella ulvae]|uniref:Uncharacterized protein n=1 Tax=Reichenbachiella ulvae TaxID=2980104 RepID=A0ABT3CVH0_9BACT|nr:hypothetical protein [Reichenbachiella ulvae]MCV9387480.1 hypothetical protein [Reichenbachiella ulvae]